MFDFIRKYLRLKDKPQYEWYCTSCGRHDFYHDDQGKLHTTSGESCGESRSACPLDVRELNS